jgi:hypothetical protein
LNLKDDSKADFYSAPFFAPNQQVAIRDFHKLIHVTGAIAPAYAGDFTLFEVGSFNADSGLWTMVCLFVFILWFVETNHGPQTKE